MDMKLNLATEFVSPLNTGIDLAEEQEMGHLLIHSGQTLNKYLHMIGNMSSTGHRNYGQVEHRQVNKTNMPKVGHYHKLVL